MYEIYIASNNSEIKIDICENYKSMNDVEEDVKSRLKDIGAIELDRFKLGYDVEHDMYWDVAYLNGSCSEFAVMVYVSRDKSDDENIEKFLENNSYYTDREKFWCMFEDGRLLDEKVLDYIKEKNY